MHDTFSPADPLGKALPLAAALPLDLPASTTHGRGPVDRGLRLLAVVALIALGLLLALFALMLSPLVPARMSLAPISPFWHRALLLALGIRVSISGPAPTPGTLQVANHISWLDILALGSQQPMRFVAKAEVQAWPLLGALAQVAGTLFIRRGQRQGATGSEAVRVQLRAALEAGECVAIFPEGTTTDGRDVRKFHPRLFVSNGEHHLSDLLTLHRYDIQIQPVALNYHGPGAAAAPFVGDDSFAAHLWRVLGAAPLSLTVSRLPALPADADAVAEQARSRIACALGVD